MTDYETLLIERENHGVIRLTLNRPEKHNAMDSRMIGELRDAVDAIAADADARVLVISGAGASFCAGADLNWMREQQQSDRAGRIREATGLANMLSALDTLPLPVIARVNGQAYGGGLGLISVCDIVIAADHARFGFTEVKLGLIPATISPYVIRRTGAARARRVFFSARLFDSAEALDLGLVARTVPAAELDGAVTKEITPFLAAAPGAVSAGKRLVHELSRPLGEEIISRTIQHLADQWETPEAAEGIAAFFDKRKPNWN